MASNMLLATSLNQLWSMLNGLQLSTHMPLFQLNVPANASFFLDFLIEVATFDPLPVEAIWAVLEFPEKGAYNDSFDSAGYNYSYSIENLGTAFVLIHIYLILALISALLLKLKCSQNIVRKTCKKITDNLFHSTSLRFFYEGYLEIGIALSISIIRMEWNSDLGPAVIYCNIFTIVLAAVMIALPVFIAVCYFTNIERLDDEKFASKYGTLYDGMKLNEDKLRQHTRKVSIWFPLAFVLRRIAFIMIAFCLSTWPVFQLIAMILITTAMIFYLMWFKPFEDNFFNHIEVMNEVTAMLLLYIMFSFTDWIPDAKSRYDYAWFFILITISNLLVHVFFLMKYNVKSIQLRWKKYMNKRNGSINKKELKKMKTVETALKVKEDEIEDDESKKSSAESGSNSDDVLISIESYEHDLRAPSS